MEDIIDVPRKLIDCLSAAERVTVLTGAGTSAESGVPTFRDAQTGLWAKFSPEDLATPEAFRQNPRRVWEWYEWRRQLVAAARPNAGHLALARLESRIPHFTLVTQNVDGLHQQAGNKRVLELHGNIARTKCFEEDTVVESWPRSSDVPPRCPRCGGLLRPDVVWFGESLPQQIFAEAETASEECDVFLCVGTSSMVYPAAGLPYTALTSGAIVIEVNPTPTALTPQATWSVRARSGEFLPELVKALES